MDSRYKPSEIETHWYRDWEARGLFEPSSEGEPYCIMLPPPNVTGSLHMGHGFQQTLMDVLVRYQRMRGRRVLWQGGVDHAGIATQMVVARQLEARGDSPQTLGRERFVEEVWKWKAESGGMIESQQRRLGASLAWSRARFTMDEGFTKAVRAAFVTLYRDGLIYRGNRLVNWDPELQTAVSDLEVQLSEEQGQLWHFRYPLTDGSGHITIATTRPETMLGDVAVAVHPEDARYQKLIGQRVKLPLVGREIPIIADDYVDPEFGSGCVKITPAHDFNDYEIGQRHQLPLINIFDAQARLTGALPAGYEGLDRFVARVRIVQELQAAGLLDKIEERPLSLPRGDRSGAVLEPWLTEQWFMRMKETAKAAREAVSSGHIRFVPDNWKNTYYTWLDDICDWCLSRQLWWGHRIPAWYDDQGAIYVGDNEVEVRRAHGLSEEVALRQDTDVLDTWFSSALWTFATLGWPDQSPQLRSFHPTNVLVTGFDIIFFWVARMVMMSLRLREEIPFSEVFVHGLVLDPRGKKMSKSQGNVLDPIDMIDGITLDELLAKRTSAMMQPQFAKQVEQATRSQFPDGIAAYGADALRFTFCALSSTNRSIRFDLGRIEGYRNFGNKLWNAARFVLDYPLAEDSSEELAEHPDAATRDVGAMLVERWIESRFDRSVQVVHEALAAYRFDHAAQAIYNFIWHEYCDWFLELSKPVLKRVDQAERVRLRMAMLRVLERALRLLHPIMPFITEDIWQRLPWRQEGERILSAPFPEVDLSHRDSVAERAIELIQSLVTAVRSVRGDLNIEPGKKLRVCLRRGDAADRETVETHGELICALARALSLQWLKDDEEAPPAAMKICASIEVLVCLSGAVDKSAELKRLRQAEQRAREAVSRSERKLANEKFLVNAPADVVAAERDGLEVQRETLKRLIERQALVARL